MPGKNILIFFLVLNFNSFSQKERGNYLEIKGNNVIKNVNHTTWKLEKIIEKKGLFKIKRKIKKEEALEISFNDGKISYRYLDDKTETTCKYGLSGNGRYYERLAIDCDLHYYYWVVYRLSDEKLIMRVNYSTDKGLSDQKKHWPLYFL